MPRLLYLRTRADDAVERRQWWGWRVGLSTVVVALLWMLVPSEGLRRQVAHGRIVAGEEAFDGESRRQELRRQVDGPRHTEGRLAGFSWGAAPSTFRGGLATAARVPAKHQLAAAMALQGIEGHETAGALYTGGLAHLVLGDIERAIELLEQSRRSSGASAAGLVSDLSSAYLERGLRAGRFADIAIAANLAGLTANLPGSSLEARFNRALALDALELPERARAAWESYLDAAERQKATIDEGAWVQEARQRLARVPVWAASKWPELRARLERGEGYGDTVALQAMAARYPVPLREFAQDVLLPAWGRARTMGEFEAAAVQTGRLERIAEALMPSGHGAFLSTAAARLHAIDRAPRSLASVQLAAGLQAYGEGRRLYELNRVSEAIPFFTTAVRDLALIRMLAGWARLHEAVGLYLDEQWRALDDALARVVADAGRLHDPALRGRAYRLLGVAAARQGRLQEALDLKERARHDYESAADGEELAGIEASLAETTEMAGRRSESWEWMRRALRRIDQINKGRREQVLFAVAVWGCVRQGFYSLAAEYQLELLQRAERRGEPIGQFEATVLAARLLHQAGRTDETVERLALAREQLAKIPDPGFRARAGFELDVEEATVRLPANPHDAVEQLTRLIAAAAKNKSVARLPDLYDTRGRAFVRMRETDAARRDFEAGLDTLDRESEGQLSAPLRLAIRDSRRQLLRDALALSISTDATGRDGLRLIEHRRAREIYGVAVAREPAADVESLQRALRHDVGVLVYASTGFQVYGWFIGPNGYRFSLLPASASMIDGLSISLRRRIISQESEVDGLATELGHLLLDPILGSGLQVPDRLFIIPDEPLHLIPFGLLRFGSKGQRLVSLTTIVNAASARAALHAELRFQDPPRVLTLAVSDARRTDLPVLREAIPEAESVVAAYGQGRVLRDSAATNAALTEGLAEADVIHVVSHAVMSEDDGLRALVLPGGDESVVATKAPLRTRLLVLSACGTADGPYVAGEGPRSIATRYLQAGVEQVVGTLWSVRDDQSRRFMTRLHSAIAHGHDVAQTLRSLEEEMAATGEAPGVWAPYVTYVR